TYTCGTATIIAPGLDAVVWKLNSDGNIDWAYQVNGIAGIAETIDYYPSGRLYVTGRYGGFLDFEVTNSNMTYSNGGEDIFVFTLDTAASLGWYHSFGGSKADRPFGASLDASGNIYITGDFRDTIDFDPGPNEELRIAAGCDIYILKLD